MFVYGREVNDFHTVDYDAISMLNVSATQELAKQLLKAQEDLAAEQAENDVLKAALDLLTERVDELDQAVRPASASK